MSSILICKKYLTSISFDRRSKLQNALDLFESKSRTITKKNCIFCLTGKLSSFNHILLKKKCFSYQFSPGDK